MFYRTRFSDRCRRALSPLATSGFCLALTGCLLTAPLRPASAHELTNITLSPTTPVVATGGNAQFTATGFFDDLSTHALRTSTVAAGTNHSCALLANDTVHAGGKFLRPAGQ